MNETKSLLTPAEQEALNLAVPAYEKARKTATDTMLQGFDGLWDRGLGFDAREDARAKLRETFQATTHTAWMAMAIGTGPIVGWILDNCEHWNDEALVVFRHLASGGYLTTIDRAANRHEWCETYWGDEDEEDIIGFRDEFIQWLDARVDA